MATNVGSAVGYLDLDIASFMAKLKEAQQGVDNTSTKSQKLASTLSTVGSSFTKTGALLSATITAPVVALGTSVVNTGKEFQTSMSQIQATMGLTADSTFALSDSVLENSEVFAQFKDKLDLTDTSAVNVADTLEALSRQLGANTKYSASEAADAINILAMAGKDANEIIEMLPSILNLASAGAMDIADSADYATGIMAGFGMESSETTKVCDTLAMMASSAKGSVSQFGEAMAACAGQASVTNQSFENTAVALEILGNHNLSAAEAGNALNRTLKNLYQPSTTGAKALDALGVSAYDATGKARPLPDVLMDLKGHLDGLSEEDYNNIMGQIFDAATMKSVPFLINDCTAAWDTADDSVTSLIEGINGASDAYGGLGAAAGQAGVQLDNLDGDIAIMKSAFDELKISLFQNAESPLRQVIQKVTELIQWFNGLSDSTKSLIIKIAAIAAVVGPLLLIIGSLCSAVSTIITFVGTMKTVIAGAKTAFAGLNAVMSANPIGIVIAAIAALVAAFIYLWNNCEEFRQFWIDLWEGIKKVAKSVADWCVEAWSDICDFFTTTIPNAFQSFCDFWVNLWNTVKDFFTNIWDGMVDFLSGVWETIKNVVQVAIMAIGEFFNAAIQIITLPFRLIWENCKEIIIPIWDSIVEFLTNTLNSIAEFFTNIWTSITEALETAWNAISEFFTTIWTAISETANTIWTAISEFFSTCWTTISNIATTVWNGISNFLSESWNTISSVATNVWNGISNFFTGIWDGLKNTVTTITNTISNTISNAWNGIKNTFTSILNGIKGTVENVFSGIKSFISGIVNWLKGIFNFSWSLPHIKLPHFSISGSFSLNPPSIPHFSVSWYKKAMRDGMIMNEPTIFGFDTKTGKFLAGGEAGSETVVGTGSLLDMIKSTVEQAISNLRTSIESLCAAVIDSFLNVSNSVANSVATLGINVGEAAQSQHISGEVGTTMSNSMIGDMMIVDAFKKAISEIKINNDVIVEMQDGDVYLDKERVGRTISPVVSRVISQGMK